MPEETEKYIRIPVKSSDLFIQKSFRQIVLSESEGIGARIGKLKSDPDGSTVIQAYRFDSDKWSMESAKEWVEKHKKKSSSSGPAERRFFESEMRMDFSNSKQPKIVGYAAVFNQETNLWPGLKEKVARGAFANTIKEDDIRGLWNHNADYLLGRNKSGTLKLWEDDKGLGYEIIMPGTSWAKDLQILIKRGDLTQSSFGFNIINRSQEYDEKNRTLTITIEKAKLFDVSPVTFPAYPQTEVHVRMIQHDQECLYFFEDSNEVIVLPSAGDAHREEKPLSDDQLFAEWEEIKKQATTPRFRQ